MACHETRAAIPVQLPPGTSASLETPEPRAAQTRPITNPRAAKLVVAAVAQFGETVLYDPSYVRLTYPAGDLPRDRGVCSDVVIRALRGAGVDLQRLVHEDMSANFAAYPKLWRLRRPDANIDHRRVANLMTYFARWGKTVPLSHSDYQPGDLVAWRLPNRRLHIGVVTDRQASDGQRLLLAHNIGAGVQLEDILFAWPVIGHYRFF